MSLSSSSLSSSTPLNLRRCVHSVGSKQHWHSSLQTDLLHSQVISSAIESGAGWFSINSISKPSFVSFQPWPFGDGMSGLTSNALFQINDKRFFKKVLKILIYKEILDSESSKMLISGKKNSDVTTFNLLCVKCLYSITTGHGAYMCQVSPRYI